CDVAAQQCLQAGTDGADNASGADNDAADDAKCFRDAVTGKFKSGGYESWIYRHSLLLQVFQVLNGFAKALNLTRWQWFVPGQLIKESYDFNIPGNLLDSFFLCLRQKGRGIIGGKPLKLL